MAKLSPLQRTKKEHGSKAELAEKVLGVLTVGDNVDQADFENSIKTMSNKKLLRLWDAHQTLIEKYETKEALIEKLTLARFVGGNADYAEKLATFSTPKLVDLGRSL